MTTGTLGMFSNKPTVITQSGKEVMVVGKIHHGQIRWTAMWGQLVTTIEPIVR